MLTEVERLKKRKKRCPERNKVIFLCKCFFNEANVEFVETKAISLIPVIFVIFIYLVCLLRFKVSRAPVLIVPGYFQLMTFFPRREW